MLLKKHVLPKINLLEELPKLAATRGQTLRCRIWLGELNSLRGAKPNSSLRPVYMLMVMTGHGSIHRKSPNRHTWEIHAFSSTAEVKGNYSNLGTTRISWVSLYWSWVAELLLCMEIQVVSAWKHGRVDASMPRRTSHSSHTVLPLSFPFW